MLDCILCRRNHSPRVPRHEDPVPVLARKTSRRSKAIESEARPHVSAGGCAKPRQLRVSFEDPGSNAPVLRPRFRDPGSETQVQRPAKRRIVISTYQARIAKSWAFGPARCIGIPNIHCYCVPLQSWHTEAAHSDVRPCRSGASLLFIIPCNAGSSHVLWHPLQESADMRRVTTAASCGIQVTPSIPA